MKFLRVLLIFIPFVFNAQTLDADYKKLYGRMEKGEDVTTADLQKLIDQYQKVLKDFPDESAELLYYRGNYLYADGKTDEAIQSLNDSYNYSLRAKDTTFKYYVILTFARISYNTKAYDKAEEYYRYALPGMVVIHGVSSIAYVKIYFEYIRLIIELGRLKEAKPLLDALEYYFVTLKMFDDPTYFAVLGNQAYVLQEMGDYKPAIAKYKDILKGDKLLKNGDTLEHIITVANLGEAYRESGGYEDATRYLNEAKRCLKKFKVVNPDQEASIENNLGLLYKTTNDYKLSEECFNNSIKIYKGNGLDDTEPYCSVLSNKADLMRLLGRKDEAIILLNESIKNREKYFGKISENYANSLSTFGFVAYELHNYKLAQEKFEEALSIYEQTIPKTHQGYANCLNSLSGCYYMNNNFKKAEEFKLEAIKIIETTLGKEHFKYITFTTGAADILIANKNHVKALQLLNESKGLAKKVFGVRHQLYINAVLSLAVVKYTKGYYKESMLDFEEGIGNKLSTISQFFHVMNKEDQEYYLEDFQDVMIEYSWCLFNYAAKENLPAGLPAERMKEGKAGKEDMGPHFQKYFDYNLIYKNLLNKSSREWQRAASESKDEAIKVLYTNWLRSKRELDDLYKSDYTWQEQDSMYAVMSANETKLKQAVGFTKDDRTDMNAIKAALKPGEAVVDVSWYGHLLTDTSGEARYAALIVKANSQFPEYVVISDEKMLTEKAVKNYHENMENEVKDSASYDQLFGKLAAKLNGITKIYLSMRGDVSSVNLQTLYDPKTKKYLLETMDIVYMPDLSAILDQQQLNTVFSADLFGNPDFNFDFRKKTHVNKKQEPQLIAKRFGLTSITELPGTETELKEIERLLLENKWKLKSFTREKASEEALRNVNSPKILHVATHGYFIKDIETSDKKFLGFNSEAFKGLADVRSGLIMAGAAITTADSVKVSSDKDGLLTAREASLLKLAKTDVVILSACQTGLGVETFNQGAIGLQQAFSNAGAKNLILSLWPVDDNATQLLMVKFYEYWLKDATNQNISAAFKKAQLDVKLKYPHPYYWGAFVLLRN